jgi:hypothetical protein
VEKAPSCRSSRPREFENAKSLIELSRRARSALRFAFAIPPVTKRLPNLRFYKRVFQDFVIMLKSSKAAFAVFYRTPALAVCASTAPLNR